MSPWRIRAPSDWLIFAIDESGEDYLYPMERFRCAAGTEAAGPYQRAHHRELSNGPG